MESTFLSKSSKKSDKRLAQQMHKRARCGSILLLLVLSCVERESGVIVWVAPVGVRCGVWDERPYQSIRSTHTPHTWPRALIGNHFHCEWLGRVTSSHWALANVLSPRMAKFRMVVDSRVCVSYGSVLSPGDRWPKKCLNSSEFAFLSGHLMRLPTNCRKVKIYSIV